MATLTLRAVKGVNLIASEMDANFTNLNNDIQTRLLVTSYTAQDVLTKLKSVDGTGSGVDSDLLQGLLPASGNIVSTIVSRDSSGNIAVNNITANTITTPSSTLSGLAPGILANETDQPSGYKNWFLGFDGQNFQIQTRDDNFAYISTPITITRAGTATLTGNLNAVNVNASGSSAVTGNLSAGSITTGPITSTTSVSSGEVQTTSLSSYRTVTGNYGTFLRNDGSDFFLLQTISGAQYGAANSFRPLQWNLGTGIVQIDASKSGTIVGGDLTVLGATNSIKSISINNAGTSGAVMKWVGNGNATPSKSLRVLSGRMEWVNDANTAVILSLTDSGDLNALGNVTAFSDKRLKTNIQTIPNSLEKVKKLRGVSYDRIDIDSHQLGVIAQEIQSVLPEVVFENSDGLLSVSYGNIVSVLIEAIKELSAKVEKLEKP